MTDDKPNELTPAVEPAKPVPTNPMEMVYRLIDNGADLDSIKEMMAMGREIEADRARRAFDADMSKAKAEITPIIKNRVVDFTSTKGRTNYRYEDLGEIARTVDPILARHGLSYRFRTEQQDGGSIRVVCRVAHRDGHSEENALVAGRDESGNKNNIQAVGSTITYLQRYTLKAALGLAASNDDDGATSEASQYVTDEQVEEIKALIDKATEARPGTDHAAWIESFLEFMKTDALNHIPAADFGKAKANIQNAIKQGARK